MSSNPSITFLGAARNVTGSRFLLADDQTRILVDCGLYQERELVARNWDPLPVDPSSIDALLLTHAHLDHSGYIPRFVADGFRGQIYCTEATAEIARILLEDSARIQEEDVATKKRRHTRQGRQGPHPYVPLYTVDNALDSMSHFHPIKYGDNLRIGDFDITFHDAGHILGSATVHISFGGKSIIFSGDLGRVDGALIHDPVPYDKADYVVVESTYGDRVHEESKDVLGHIAKVINDAVAARGNVLIPSFAVERAQDLIYKLKTLVEEQRIPPLMFFVDSPMATDVTHVFEHYPELLDPELKEMLERGESPFRFTGLTFTKTVNESKAINNIHGTAVIIAGSGMCTGGRIKHHLANNIEDPACTVLFVGYQARGTLGRLLVDGVNPVRILGREWQVRAKIDQIQGLSAHADVNGLKRWLSHIDTAPKKTFVVHGEEESALSFAQALHDEHGWDAIAPEYGDTFELV